MSSAQLLPPNRTATETALEEVVARHDVPVRIREVWNADTCPADLLPWLARAVSVDVWEPSWTPEQKRKTIKASLEVHRHKGTIGAVRDALRALGFEAKVQEWFNQIPAGPEYTYRLILEADQIGFSASDIDLLMQVVGNTKNLRSHLTEIRPVIRTLAGPVTAAFSTMGVELTLGTNDIQEAAIIPGFRPAENELNTVTNINLPQSLGA